MTTQHFWYTKNTNKTRKGISVKKLKFLLPVPLDATAARNFANQIPAGLLRPDFTIDFAGCRAGGFNLENDYDSALSTVFVLDAGARAEEDGYAAVCSFSMSDTGLAPLRSRLSIPVIGTAQASFALAQQLGPKFSVVTMWAPWARRLKETVDRYGLSSRLASVRHIGTPPDTRNLLSSDPDVFARLEAEALAAIEQDGADVVILGSTTMYAAYEHLAAVLPCPVVNPGLAAYKACETLLDLRLSHSKLAYPSPAVTQDGLFEAIGPIARP